MLRFTKLNKRTAPLWIFKAYCPAAAFLAAQRAFIEAASLARPSGVNPVFFAGVTAAFLPLLLTAVGSAGAGVENFGVLVAIGFDASDDVPPIRAESFS